MQQIDLADLRQRISLLGDAEASTPVTRRFLEQIDRELTEARLKAHRSSR